MWNDGAIAMDWRGIPRAIYDELGRKYGEESLDHLESHCMKEVL